MFSHRNSTDILRCSEVYDSSEAKIKTLISLPLWIRFPLDLVPPKSRVETHHSLNSITLATRSACQHKLSEGPYSRTAVRDDTAASHQYKDPWSHICMAIRDSGASRTCMIDAQEPHSPIPVTLSWVSQMVFPQLKKNTVTPTQSP
jgi:hypothetical protein